MDSRAAKLALARKKLKDHQVKKSVVHKDDSLDVIQQNPQESIQVSDASAIPAIATDCQNAKEVEFTQNINETYYFQNDHSNLNPQDTGGSVETYFLQHDPNLQNTGESVNVTEILISNKRNLEMQVTELQLKISQLEGNQTLLINHNDVYKQQINDLQNQLKRLNDDYLMISDELQSKERMFKELNTIKTSISEENSNLQEQLEFTKTMLTTKESENASLHNHLSSLQNQLDLTQLQLQQLTSGSQTCLSQSTKNDTSQNTEALLQKISSLEQQLKTLQKEKDQMNSHYEHYVNELNEQLRSVVTKNEELMKEIQMLSNRENSLIEQISDMEIRLQNYHIVKQEFADNQALNVRDLQQEYKNVQTKFQELSSQYNDLQKRYAESEIRVQELSKIKSDPDNNDNITISMSKLNADIASDKVAVQRATEQNKKLKTDVQELEDAFVKISKDKLELTEKLDAEKFLNRELTIKLAEVDEKAKDLYTKLIAKDEEMIRLQTSYREIKSQLQKLLEESVNSIPVKNEDEKLAQQEPAETGMENKDNADHNNEGESLIKPRLEESRLKIPKEDAMLKLQDRFLKIMDEVANLSDEKYRLEHIILQLQNETDTICEYVALYQQQRSLLKKRDEERSAQIKIFQYECELLKNQLEELSIILIRLTRDKELLTYFENENRNHDVAKIMNLLSNLKNSSVLDPKRECSELKDFYPCNCCSGKLIDL